jgi:general secretion pathway protein G
MEDKKERKYSRRQQGITLIELMVVMVILGLLAALVAPRMFGKVGQATYTQIELFGTALDAFRLDVGRYPSTSEGLEALLKSPSGEDTWLGPYLKKEEIPNDPWREPYRYDSPGSHGDYDLYSYGADKAAGGDGENKDIVSWKGLD